MAFFAFNAPGISPEWLEDRTPAESRVVAKEVQESVKDRLKFQIELTKAIVKSRR